MYMEFDKKDAYPKKIFQISCCPVYTLVFRVGKLHELCEVLQVTTTLTQIVHLMIAHRLGRLVKF